MYLVVGRVEHEGGLGGDAGDGAARRALVSGAAKLLPYQAAEWPPRCLGAAAAAPGRLGHTPPLSRPPRLPFR